MKIGNPNEEEERRPPSRHEVPDGRDRPERHERPERRERPVRQERPDTDIEDSDVLRQDTSYKERSSPKKIVTSLVKKDKKFIIIGAGLLVVAVIIVSVFGRLGKKSDEPSDTVQEIVANTDVSDAADSGNMGSSLISQVSEEQKEKLRSAGYTGDDIENLQNTGGNVDDALASAKKSKRDYLFSLYKELDPSSLTDGSDAYKALLSNTWVGGDLRPVSKETNEMYVTKTIRENCRYVKIAPKGGQLFIKLSLKNGDSLFYNIHPETYDRLDDEGNMVIDYDEVKYGASTYYLNIKEIPIK